VEPRRCVVRLTQAVVANRTPTNQGDDRGQDANTVPNQLVQGGESQLSDHAAVSLLKALRGEVRCAEDPRATYKNIP